MAFFRIMIFLFYYFVNCECGGIFSSQLLKSCLKLKGVSPSAAYVERNDGSGIYQKLNYQWNTVHGTITPLAYFLPVLRRDVQIAIKCGRKLGIKMVAKSGGHSYAKYSFGNSQTVVIDLQEMSNVTVDPATFTATVGSGTLTGRLYSELWANGKFGIPGPNGITVGVAGFTLGGGFSNWSRQFGLMIDNVVSMDFISPTGKFMVLSETQNADLFWAMRGVGGGNFGIVTQFKFKVFQAASIKTNRITLEFEAKKFKKIFGIFQSFVVEMLDGVEFFVLRAHSESITIFSTNTNLTVQSIKNKLEEFGIKSENVKISHQSVNFIDDVVASAIPNVSTPSKLGVVKQTDYPKVFFRAKSYFLQKLLSRTEITALEPFLLQIPKDVRFSVEVFGGAINRVSSTATSFVHRNAILRIQIWRFTDHKTVNIWVKKLDKILIRMINSEESYQNCIDEELRPNGEYLHRYYGKNLARLVKIKNVIDPDDYFKFPMSIPLQLPE